MSRETRYLRAALIALAQKRWRNGLLRVDIREVLARAKKIREEDSCAQMQNMQVSDK